MTDSARAWIRPIILLHITENLFRDVDSCQWFPCTQTPRPDYAIHLCPKSHSVVNDPHMGGFYADEPASIFLFCFSMNLIRPHLL